MRDEILMGIDIGTSGVKTVIMSVDGVVLASATEEYRVDTPQPGWAEQMPDVWYNAALATIRAVLSSANQPGARVKAIGFSGQMHSTVLLDRRGQVVRPAIIWADQRTRDQVARVYAEIGAERLAAWTGNPLATGFMLATWLWLIEHEPRAEAETSIFVLPKDYVRYRFTGTLGAEPSDASSTCLFSPVARTWSHDLLAALKLNPVKLAPISPSSTVAGGLLSRISHITGLRPDTPVIMGGSDQAMQALGNGIVRPGVVSSTIGTGGQLFAPTDRCVVDPDLRMHSFCHVLPDIWHVETAILTAGLALKWFRDQVLTGQSYQDMADLAAEVTPGAEGLFFLPHLSGERTPYMDPLARGSFTGLTLRHGRGHLIRALMEGVVFAMRQGLDIMLELGVPAECVIASGGATAHPLWLQLQADIYQRPIYRTTVQRQAGDEVIRGPLKADAAAVGAAMLAGIGVGLYADASDAISRVVAFDTEVVAPDPEASHQYEQAYESYSKLYAALKPANHCLSTLARFGPVKILPVERRHRRVSYSNLNPAHLDRR